MNGRRYPDARDELAHRLGYSISRYRAADGSIRWAYTLTRGEGSGHYVDGFERRAWAVQEARRTLAAALPYSAGQVTCPICGARPGALCSSPSGRRVDYHQARDNQAALNTTNTTHTERKP